MIQVRAGSERGRGERSWLDSRHTFSFGEYYDPKQMGFGTLRVINEDWIRGGGGFPAHPHRDMEILTYVLEGALEHRDSLGTSSVIRPGEVQRMSAGTGIVHSEANASRTETVHLLQIWILPERAGLVPGYEQKEFPASERQGRLRLVASRDGRDGAVTVHQGVELYAALLAPGETAAHRLRPGRQAWLQVARGQVTLNGRPLAAGDGAAVTDEAELTIQANEAAEVLLFDLGADGDR
jgi:redox-sensitive bicupin YhaK (pirin superfamily)